MEDYYRWADNLILDAVPRAFDKHADELERLEGPQGHRLAENLPPTLATRKQLEPTVVALLRRGYRKALRRYESADLYTVGNSVFKRLDEFSRRLVQSEMLPFGARVRINVDVRSGHISASTEGYLLDI